MGLVHRKKVTGKSEKNLKKRNYNVKVEDGNVLAEKGRFSRWGPYVNHIGLIIFYSVRCFVFTEYVRRRSTLVT